MKASKFLEGLTIILKHDPKTDIRAEHDQIWVGEHDSGMSPEEEARLKKLGFFEDEDAWSCFT